MSKPSVCQEDLVGFNFHNTGLPLMVGVPTVVNDALFIDTRSLPNYSGVVTLTIGNLVGMVAEFVGSGTTTITLPVLANTLLAVPLRVTATDCGFDRMYWQFTVYYDATPLYGQDDGEGTPCFKQGRIAKVLRWDAKIKNNCYADFTQHLLELSGAGNTTVDFNLQTAPQCTGPVQVTMTTECPGISFTGSNQPFQVIDNGAGIIISVPYGETDPLIQVSFDYDTDQIQCYCTITAYTQYENATPNPNLITGFGNNGSMSGLYGQSQFNTALVYARDSTVFTTVPGNTYATALRVTLSTPVDQSNPPNPLSYVTPDATNGSIFWQTLDTAPQSLSPSTRYWLRVETKIDPANPIILANELVHIDKFIHAGQTFINAAIPYITKFTPLGQWLTNGIRFKTGTGSTQEIIPFVRYINTTATGVFTPLIGDLYLEDGGVSDWGNVVLERYYPTDPIVCPNRTLTVKNALCEYMTVLDVQQKVACDTVDFADNSDFGYTPGHAQSDFTLYRKVDVTMPDGSQVVLSSIVPYNIAIQAAAATSNPFYTDFPVSEMGYYYMTMCECPTFRTDIAYSPGTGAGDADCVCLLDSFGVIHFFRCLVSMPGFTPLVSMGWQNYWVEVPENGLSSKYCSTQTYVSICGLLDCIKKYRNKLYCSLDIICSNNICDNECMTNYLRLVQLYDVLTSTDSQENPYFTGTELRDALNWAKELCECTCDCQ